MPILFLWVRGFPELLKIGDSRVGRKETLQSLVEKPSDTLPLALFRSLFDKRQLSRKNKFDKLSGMFPALVFVAF